MSKSNMSVCGIRIWLLLLLHQIGEDVKRLRGILALGTFFVQILGVAHVTEPAGGSELAAARCVVPHARGAVA